jgi:hypothetical protein
MKRKAKALKPFSMKLTIAEYRYALALSKRVPECPRPDSGSVAHGLKWCLRENAKREGVLLE